MIATVIINSISVKPPARFFDFVARFPALHQGHSTHCSSAIRIRRPSHFHNDQGHARGLERLTERDPSLHKLSIDSEFFQLVAHGPKGDAEFLRGGGLVVAVSCSAFMIASR